MNMWALYAFLCSLFNAIHGAYGKKLLTRMDHYLITWAMFAFAFPFIATVLLIVGFPPVKPPFWFAMAVSLLVNCFAFTFYVKAIQLSPLALTFPFLAFTPLFLILTSYVTLGEAPNLRGGIGILLIVVGAYLLNLDRLRQGFLGPLRAIHRERGSLLMLMVAAIWGISASMDKMAVINSSPFFYLAVFHLVFPVVYLPILLVKSRESIFRIKREAPALLLFGGLGALTVGFQMMAIKLALVSFVIAIKRAGMVFSIALGYLFFQERGLAQHLVGAILMIGGVACILL